MKSHNLVSNCVPFGLSQRKTLCIFGRMYQFQNVTFETIEAVVQRCSVKKMFLEISQNSQENLCSRVSFLIKLQASGHRPATLSKKRLWHRCLPVNFVKFLRTPFYKEHLWWLLLKLVRPSELRMFRYSLFHSITGERKK